MWTEKLEHFQLLHKLNLQIIFQIGNFWNFAGKEYQRELMKETHKWSVVFMVRTENVAPDRIPERMVERNTKVVKGVLGQNRKRCPRENWWEKHKCGLLSFGPQQEMFPQRESMRETQRLSIVCWATTGNVSPARIPEIIDVYCMLFKNRKCCLERIPEILNERNTKVVYCLLIWTLNVAPKRIPERIDESKTSCLLSVGPQQETFPHREYQRESRRTTQTLSVVCWATTGNISPERIPKKIDESNTKVVFCLLRGKTDKKKLKDSKSFIEKFNKCSTFTLLHAYCKH